MPKILNKILKKHWLRKYNWKIQTIWINKEYFIYPKDFFYPYAYFEIPNDKKITKNTVSIHNYSATRLPNIVKKTIFPIIWLIIKVFFNTTWKK